MWGFLRQPMWCFQNFSLCSKQPPYSEMSGYGGFESQSAKDRKAKYMTLWRDGETLEVTLHLTEPVT